MTTTRDRFLQTVRRAVAEGNRAGQVPGHPERGDIGYQGAGSDPLCRFRDEIRAAGGILHVVPDGAAATPKVVELLQGVAARRVLLGRGAVLEALSLAEALQSAGVQWLAADRDAVFSADVGVTGVDYLIAETGSIVLFSGPDQPRSASLLPPVHIAVATRDQLLPDLFDLFERQKAAGQGIRACMTVITGPSKTGDIELKLVTGVHGPGEVHVVLIDGVKPQAGSLGLPGDSVAAGTSSAAPKVSS
jgi:L-lactate utilization protein LutC